MNDQITAGIRRLRGIVWLCVAGIVAVAVGMTALALHVLHRQEIADGRQHQADVRAERQRRAICAILATIPNPVAPEIKTARDVFSRHPGDCQPQKGAVPKPTPVRVYINGKPATIIVNPQPSAGVSSRPRSARSPSPRPSPSSKPTPTSSPTPSPSPTPTCIPVPLHHAVCLT